MKVKRADGYVGKWPVVSTTDSSGQDVEARLEKLSQLSELWETYEKRIS